MTVPCRGSAIWDKTWEIAYHESVPVSTGHTIKRDGHIQIGLENSLLAGRDDNVIRPEYVWPGQSKCIFTVAYSSRIVFIQVFVETRAEDTDLPFAGDLEVPKRSELM